MNIKVLNMDTDSFMSCHVTKLKLYNRRTAVPSILKPGQLEEELEEEESFSVAVPQHHPALRKNFNTQPCVITESPVSFLTPHSSDIIEASPPPPKTQPVVHDLETVQSPANLPFDPGENLIQLDLPLANSTPENLAPPSSLLSQAHVDSTLRPGTATPSLTDNKLEDQTEVLQRFGGNLPAINLDQNSESEDDNSYHSTEQNIARGILDAHSSDSSESSPDAPIQPRTSGRARRPPDKYEAQIYF